MKIRNNDGFTLVELLVTIVVASIVAAAAGTVLLMGIRLNANSTNTAQRQNTTRVFLTMIENLGSNGTLDNVVSDGFDEEGLTDDKPIDVRWYVEGEDDKILFYYDPDADTIYSGGEITAAVYTPGVPLMEGVKSSYIEKADNFLTVTLETEDGEYSSSVYCRNGTSIVMKSEVESVIQKPEDAISNALRDKTARAEFLKKLLSQLGSRGMELQQIGNQTVMTSNYFAKWYDQDWPTDTPWCACYISWALAEVKTQCFEESVEPPKYANVDDFVQFFIGKSSWTDLSKTENADKVPNPGDIIFMDWTRQQKDAAHVGVVLAVKGGYIYTIEGNTANMVAVRKYPVGDKVLMGYGVIDWTPDT